MSYILEALKKAQAERQIGSTPTIHAPTLASVPAGPDARSKRTPLVVALVLMGTAIAGLATMLMRQQPAAAPVAASQPAAAAPTIAAGQQPSTVAAVPQPPAVASTVQPPAAHIQPPAAAPAAPASQPPVAAPVAAAAPQAPAAKAVPQAAVAAAQPQAAPRSVEASTPVPAPAIAQQAPAPAEDPVQALRELPEPIQRAIPQITLGGYMYSKNPADRLLLIDKVLRREGEEVAPGLVLEKLQPKQAVFGFRGYRYRVAL